MQTMVIVTDLRMFDSIIEAFKRVNEGVQLFVDALGRLQQSDISEAIARELKAFAAERAPRYPKHHVPNALLRQRRADMLRASTRPGAEWMAGHARKVVRRVHRHRRR